jgi:hypothetical protein
LSQKLKKRASHELADDLGWAIANAWIDYESEKGREKLERMLDDHKKLLYQIAKMARVAR